MTDLEDVLILETLFGLQKQAQVSPLETAKSIARGFVPDIVSSVKNYFKSKIDEGHPTASIIDDLAPGVISMTMSAMGLGGWGMLIGLLFSTLHIDVNGVLSTIYDGVKSLLSDNGKVSPDQINSLVNSAIEKHASDSQQVNDGQTQANLHTAKIIRLAMIDFEHQTFKLSKGEKISLGISIAKPATSLLARIFGFIIKVALRSAGLLLAGDVVNKMLGRPNSLTGDFKQGHDEPVATTPAEGTYVSNQTAFPLKPDSPLPETVSLPNTPANIEATLIQYAKDVYQGLDDKDSIIANDPLFQTLKEKIVWYNSRNTGYAVFSIPPFWKTKKQLVDTFIDSIANDVKHA
jgi:hypothetical protein